MLIFLKELDRPGCRSQRREKLIQKGPFPHFTGGELTGREGRACLHHTANLWPSWAPEAAEGEDFGFVPDPPCISF